MSPLPSNPMIWPATWPAWCGVPPIGYCVASANSAAAGVRHDR
jgi:hypothetical protein